MSTPEPEEAGSSAVLQPVVGQPHRPAGTKPSIPDHEIIRMIGRGAYGEVWLARSLTGA